MSGDQRSIKRLIERATELEERGAYARSLVCWREIVKDEPSPEWFCRHGRAAAKAQQWAEGTIAYQKAIELAPRFGLAYDGLASLLRDSGDLVGAEALLRRSVALEPTAIRLTLLGNVLTRLGKDREAQSVFEEAVEIDSSWEEAYYNLGVGYRLANKLERARECLQRAVELDPEYQLAYRELGWALQQLGRCSEAEAQVRRAIDLDESDAWARIYLGNILWSKGDTRGAKAEFRKAIRLWPESGIGQRCLANVLESTGPAQDAERWYRKSLEADDCAVPTLFDLGRFFARRGRMSEARPYFERVLELEPGHARATKALEDLDE